MESALPALAQHLSEQPPGRIEQSDEVQDLLYRCWDELIGSSDGGMASDKLIGRMEDVEWAPPILSFGIERHGGTVQGSVYAEIQGWSVDVLAGKASQYRAGQRVVGTKNPPLKVEPLANEIAGLILTGATDQRLKWLHEDEVRVNIGLILPSDSAPNQTVQGRRRRFWAALEEKLGGEGWVKLPKRLNTYNRNRAPE
jgi:hypothetical protein